MNVSRLRLGPAAILAGLLILNYASIACAHPMVENGLDVVIRPDRITIDARISPEEILLVAGWPATQPATGHIADDVSKHASYVRDHLKVKVDGEFVSATSADATNPHAMDSPAGAAAGASLVPYRLEYPLARPPGVVQIDQSFLREFSTWSASFVLRIRQIDDAAFDTALLTRERTAEFDCAWPATTNPIAHQNHPGTGVRLNDFDVTAPRRDVQKNAPVTTIIHEHVRLFVAAVVLGGSLFVFFLWRLLRSRRRAEA